jgi:TonB family protein
MNAYYTVIWSKIRGKWVLPQGILPRENIYAVIQARILKNGMVADLNFEKYSGNRYFDESAMKAIKKASPFPPLPDSIKDNSIEVGIRFHSSEFK